MGGTGGHVVSILPPPPPECPIWFALISSIVRIRISRRRAAATAFVSLKLLPGCGRAGAGLARGCRPRPPIQPWPPPAPTRWEQRPARPRRGGAGLGLEGRDNPRRAGSRHRRRGLGLSPCTFNPIGFSLHSEGVPTSCGRRKSRASAWTEALAEGQSSALPAYVETTDPSPSRQGLLLGPAGAQPLPGGAGAAEVTAWPVGGGRVPRSVRGLALSGQHHGCRRALWGPGGAHRSPRETPRCCGSSERPRAAGEGLRPEPQGHPGAGAAAWSSCLARVTAFARHCPTCPPGTRRADHFHALCNNLLRT